MYLWIRAPYPNSLHLSELATFSRLPAIHFKAPYALRLRTYCPLATSAVTNSPFWQFAWHTNLDLVRVRLKSGVFQIGIRGCVVCLDRLEYVVL
jgi:hypothetical protein